MCLTETWKERRCVRCNQMGLVLKSFQQDIIGLISQSKNDFILNWWFMNNQCLDNHLIYV